MNESTIYIDTSDPRIIAYNVYFTPDGTQMSVLHIHRDQASLEFHMKVAGPKFPSFAQFIKLLSTDIYGRPSDELLEQLQHKARLLGTGNVLIHDLHSGFTQTRIPLIDEDGKGFRLELRFARLPCTKELGDNPSAQAQRPHSANRYYERQPERVINVETSHVADHAKHNDSRTDIGEDNPCHAAPVRERWETRRAHVVHHDTAVAACTS